jgi:hypothetical protein
MGTPQAALSHEVLPEGGAIPFAEVMQRMGMHNLQQYEDHLATAVAGSAMMRSNLYIQQKSVDYMRKNPSGVGYTEAMQEAYQDAIGQSEEELGWNSTAVEKFKAMSRAGYWDFVKSAAQHQIEAGEKFAQQNLDVDIASAENIVRNNSQEFDRQYNLALQMLEGNRGLLSSARFEKIKKDKLDSIKLQYAYAVADEDPMGARKKFETDQRISSLPITKYNHALRYVDQRVRDLEKREHRAKMEEQVAIRKMDQVEMTCYEA